MTNTTLLNDNRRLPQGAFSLTSPHDELRRGATALPDRELPYLTPVNPTFRFADVPAPPAPHSLWIPPRWVDVAISLLILAAASVALYQLIAIGQP